MEQNILPAQWNIWNIVEEIGHGSFGTVYRAENAQGEVCAIKIMDVSAEMRDVCEKEIEMLLSLQDCGHVVRVYEHCMEETEEGYRFYIRMECLESLKKYTERTKPDEAAMIGIAIQLCDALEECHDKNVIHRDVKLDNILVDEALQEIRLTDFGVARVIDPGDASLSLRGTFGYMAPEIFFGRQYDLRVDIYSLGMVLYRLMNRDREPFVPTEKRLVIYKDREQSLTRRMKGEKLPAPISASENFAQIILKACAFDPNDRYLTIKELKQDLVRLQKGQYRKERLSAGQKRKLGIGIAAAAFVAVLAGTMFWNRNLHGVHAAYDPKNAVLTVSGQGVVDKKLINDYTEAKHLVIEDGITGIEKQCFEDFFELESLEAGDTLTEIGDYAFNNCFALQETDIEKDDAIEQIGIFAFANTALTEFTLPEKVTRVEDGTFSGCMELAEVQLGPQVTAIGHEAFAGCEKLQSPEMPATLETMGEGVFKNCSNLAKIVIPDGIVAVPKEAFRECTGLKEVVLSKDTTELEEDCFAFCKALSKIEGIERISSFGGCSLEGSKWLTDQEKTHDWVIVGDKYLLSYAGKETEIEIPKQVTYIGSDAFNGNTRLRKITIHDGVEYIGDSAFCGCAYAEFIFENRDQVKFVGEDAFTGTRLTAER